MNPMIAIACSAFAFRRFVTCKFTRVALLACVYKLTPASSRLLSTSSQQSAIPEKIPRVSMFAASLAFSANSEVFKIQKVTIASSMSAAFLCLSAHPNVGDSVLDAAAVILLLLLKRQEFCGYVAAASPDWCIKLPGDWTTLFFNSSRIPAKLKSHTYPSMLFGSVVSLHHQIP